MDINVLVVISVVCFVLAILFGINAIKFRRWQRSEYYSLTATWLSLVAGILIVD